MLGLVTRGRWLPVLVLLLLCVQGRAWAQAGVDPPTVVNVTSGRNVGEVEGLKDLLCHPKSNSGWSFGWTRDQDTRGTPIPGGYDLGNNGRAYGVAGVAVNAPTDTPPGPGCQQHGLGYNYPNWNDYGQTLLGSINVEQWLIAQAADPGRYVFTFTPPGGGAPYVFHRWFKKWPEKGPVWVQLRDSAGRPIPGVTINGDRPWSPYNVGTTDSAGNLLIDLPCQHYRWTFTKTGYNTRSQVFYIPDWFYRQESDGVLIKTFTLYTSSETNPGSVGSAKITVVDNVNGQYIEGATVSIGGKTYYQKNGQGVLVDGLIQGAKPTTGNASGYIAKTVTVNVSSNQVVQQEIRLDRAVNGDGDGDGSPGGGSGGGFPSLTDLSDWLTGLFTPSEASLQKWKDLGQKFRNWGPFGVFTDAMQAWNSAARIGEDELCFNIGFQLAGEGSPGVAWCLDMRPQLSGTETYEDGGKGSRAGDFIAFLRPVLGGVVWVGFLFGLWTWFRPRVQV